MYIYICICMYIYIYIFAEASMASGRVNAGPPILKGGFPSPYPSHRPSLASRSFAAKYRPPLKMFKKGLFCSTFPRMGPQGSIKKPPSSQGPSRASQGRPNQPPSPRKMPKALPRTSKSSKDKKQRFLHVFISPPMAT